MNSDEFMNKVKATLNTAGDLLGRAAETTTKKAGDFYDKSKLIFRLAEVKGEIEDFYQELGRLVYRFHKGENISEEETRAIIGEIDDRRVLVAELKEKLQEMKSTRPCPSCGKENDKAAEYCSFCGGKM